MEKTGSHLNVAIDGPAGVGKTTIGLALARALEACFVDTGIMYRGIAYLSIQNNISLKEQSKIAQLATETIFTLVPDDDGIESKLLINGHPFTDVLHSNAVNGSVSQVAMIPAVRDPLVAWQRSLATQKRTVMVGRDITTTVLPEAKIKIYLDASLEERNRRRSLQNDQVEPRQDVLSDTLNARDIIDSTRITSPLYVGSDVTQIDTTDLTFDQVFETILAAAQDVTQRCRTGCHELNL